MEQQQLFIQMALQAWNMQIQRTGQLVDTLSDEALLKEIAPGKNRGIYVLGHLIAVNDAIFTMFGAGQRSYADLETAFISTPDKSEQDMPSPAVLRDYWKKSNEELSAYFSQMSPADWFSRHTAMTDEDFVKTPTRNKLAVLLNRTGHVAYHLGQLMLAK